jgi:hypothetical protein
MNLNGSVVRNLVAPSEPWYSELAEFSVEVVPFALGALEMRARKYIWATPDDWKRGRRLIRELQVGLLMGGLQELIESNRQIYRLLDTSLNGAAYSETGIDPATGIPIITPAIPAAPSAGANPDVRANLEAIRLLVEASGANTDEVENLINLVLLALA